MSRTIAIEHLAGEIAAALYGPGAAQNQAVECIRTTLRNHLPEDVAELHGRVIACEHANQSIHDRAAQEIAAARGILQAGEAPKRSIRLFVELHADSRGALADELQQLAGKVLTDQQSSLETSGGVRSGFTALFSEDETMTHEKYVANLTAYLDQKRAARKAQEADHG